MKTRWRPKRSNVRTLKIHLYYRFSNDGPLGHEEKTKQNTQTKKNFQIKERNHSNWKENTQTKKERQANENGNTEIIDENMQVKVERRNDGQEHVLSVSLAVTGRAVSRFLFGFPFFFYFHILYVCLLFTCSVSLVGHRSNFVMFEDSRPSII